MTLEEAWEEAKMRAKALAILQTARGHITKPYRVGLDTECMLRGNDGYLAPRFTLEASDIGWACIIKPLGRN